MTTEQKIKYIADHYGYEPQSRQLIEELSELIQAVCKHNRALTERSCRNQVDAMKKDAIIEEMADVTIMMCQLQHILGIGNLDLDSKIERKLDRQIERIKNE